MSHTGFIGSVHAVSSLHSPHVPSLSHTGVPASPSQSASTMHFATQK